MSAVETKRYVHPTWEGIGTIALAGPLVVIGRRGGFGVAAFRLDDGTLAWDAQLDLPDHPRAVTSVGVHDGLVLAQGKDRVFFLDPQTGAVVRTVEIAPLGHAFFAGGRLFGLGPDPVWWGRGGGMAYRIDAAAMELVATPGFENIGAVSSSGRFATGLAGYRIAVVEVATGDVVGTIARSGRHAFRGEVAVVVVDDANVAHEHALDGTELRDFPLGEDMASLPKNRRARPAVPYIDPTGDYLVIPRVAPRMSTVDDTVAIYDARSGALLATTERHARLRGDLDPRYYGDEYSPVEHPAVLRHGEDLIIGAPAGLTAVRLPLRGDKR